MITDVLIPIISREVKDKDGKNRRIRAFYRYEV